MLKESFVLILFRYVYVYITSLCVAPWSFIISMKCLVNFYVVFLYCCLSFNLFFCQGIVGVLLRMSLNAPLVCFASFLHM